MHEYDAALKSLLRGPAQRAMQILTGTSIESWLDIELPQIRTLKMDLIGRTSDDTLIHIELQSGNDAEMPIRMAEYALGAYRMLGSFPRQIVLYVGRAAVRMETRLTGPGFEFHYELVDIRDLDGEWLLASEQVGDNVLAILGRLRDRRSAVHEIVVRIAGLEQSPRESAVSQLIILAGLRGLEDIVEREIKIMPITESILDHKVLGREIKKGILIGELKLLRGLIERRFGALPAWAEQRLDSRSAREIEAISLRLFDAESLEELLK